MEFQRAANCIIGNVQINHVNLNFGLLLWNIKYLGKDYSERVVIHEEVSPRNQQWMKDFRQQVMAKFEGTPATSLSTFIRK